MGYKKPYSLYPRKAKGGKIVWYFRTYDENGNRTTGKSTGQTCKTAAQQYVTDLIKRGTLITKGNPSFEKYAGDWWVWGKCKYIQNRLARGITMSQGYADTRRTYLDRHILPYFKNKRLQSITTRMIEKWMMNLYKNPDIHLSPTTINQCFSTLRIMLKEAVRLNYIPSNPAAGIGLLGEKRKKRGILTPEEAKRLFEENRINDIWGEQVNHYILNMVSASTGMRMGEIQALQVQFVKPAHIEVNHSWSRKYGIKDPKWNSFRVIPIPGKVSNYLQMIINQSPHQDPEDLVFYGRDRHTPIYHKIILKALYKAFEKIGITGKKREERNITFHSWRHFFNTYLRNMKISDSKVRVLTGHKSEKMTENYTHFQVEDFQDVVRIQEGMF